MLNKWTEVTSSFTRSRTAQTYAKKPDFWDSNDFYIVECGHQSICEATVWYLFCSDLDLTNKPSGKEFAGWLFYHGCFFSSLLLSFVSFVCGLKVLIHKIQDPMNRTTPRATRKEHWQRLAHSVKIAKRVIFFDKTWSIFPQQTVINVC